MFTTYKGAERFLNGQKEKELDKRTRLLRKTDSRIILIYHETPIIQYYADGSYLLSHGGWQTRTTRDRLEEFTPFTISGSYESGWSGRRPKNWREWEITTPVDSARFLNPMFIPASFSLQSHKKDIFNQGGV